MMVLFPFWVRQVDAESLPPWCAVALLATIIVSVILLVIAIIKGVQE